MVCNRTTERRITILDALKDENLFKSLLGPNLRTWRPWFRALRALYGLPIRNRKASAFIKRCTGRVAKSLPRRGFETALFLCGRRSGKSRIAAFIAAFETVLGGYEDKLAPGEEGVYCIVSPTKEQSQKVFGYLKAIFERIPLFAAEVEKITSDGIRLRHNLVIKIRVGDWRSVRGDTLIGIIADEICFMGMTEESKVKNDKELIQALEPGLATTGGKLIAISSPYAKRGWAYHTWKKHYGNELGHVLVWQAPTRTMNPNVSKAYVARKIKEDRQAASSEFLARWRDDISGFLSRDEVERHVVKGRPELPFSQHKHYFAFVDVSGGRSDDAALAIAHKQGEIVVLDVLRRYRPPFNPSEVIGLMGDVLKAYRIRRVSGDNYAAEFVPEAFEEHGIKYFKSEKNRSELYLEFLPRLTSGQVELLDEETLIDQLANLERRTRSGGKDTIDHPSGGHDDLANVAAGVVFNSTQRVVMAGGFSVLFPDN